MSPQSNIVTNPSLLRLLRRKRRRIMLDRVAVEKQKRIRRIVYGRVPHRGGRLQRMGENIDAMATKIKTMENLAGDDIDQAKQVLRIVVSLCDQVLDDAEWLRAYGYSPLIDSVQMDSLDYIAREGSHNLKGALDAVSNKKETFQYLATQTSELSKHIHAVVTGRPPLGEEYWPGSEET